MHCKNTQSTCFPCTYVPTLYLRTHVNADTRTVGSVAYARSPPQALTGACDERRRRLRLASPRPLRPTTSALRAPAPPLARADNGNVFANFSGIKRETSGSPLTAFPSSVRSKKHAQMDILDKESVILFFRLHRSSQRQQIPTRMRSHLSNSQMWNRKGGREEVGGDEQIWVTPMGTKNGRERKSLLQLKVASISSGSERERGE